jgi:hypothetical protein
MLYTSIFMISKRPGKWRFEKCSIINDESVKSWLSGYDLCTILGSASIEPNGYEDCIMLENFLR